MDWQAAARRHDPATLEGRLYAGFRRLIATRRDEAAFAGTATTIVAVGNDHVFAFTRQGAGGHALIFANVTEQLQTIDGNQLRLHGLAYRFRDLLSGEPFSAARPCTLAPYQLLCLVPE